MRYYMTMVEEKNYAVDQNKLKEYFPLHVVTKGKFGIFFFVIKCFKLDSPCWHSSCFATFDVFYSETTVFAQLASKPGVLGKLALSVESFFTFPNPLPHCLSLQWMKCCVLFAIWFSMWARGRWTPSLTSCWHIRSFQQYMLKLLTKIKFTP